MDIPQAQICNILNYLQENLILRFIVIVMSVSLNILWILK